VELKVIPIGLMLKRGRKKNASLNPAVFSKTAPKQSEEVSLLENKLFMSKWCKFDV
jgi:hypothetical protein